MTQRKNAPGTAISSGPSMMTEREMKMAKMNKRFAGQISLDLNNGLKLLGWLRRDGVIEAFDPNVGEMQTWVNVMEWVKHWETEEKQNGLR